MLLNGVLKHKCGKQLLGDVVADVSIHSPSNAGLSSAVWLGALDLAGSQGGQGRLTPLSGGNDPHATGLLACRGECDYDGQCAAGLRCFQRSNGEPIPGCRGQGGGKDWDYCFNATRFPQTAPAYTEYAALDCSQPGRGTAHAQGGLASSRTLLTHAQCKAHCDWTPGCHCVVMSANATAKNGTLGTCLQRSSCNPEQCQRGGGASASASKRFSTLIKPGGAPFQRARCSPKLVEGPKSHWSTSKVHSSCDDPAYYGVSHSKTGSSTDSAACLEAAADKSVWIQLDLGAVSTVLSLTTTGRPKSTQHVQTYAVFLSTDGSSFRRVACVEQDASGDCVGNLDTRSSTAQHLSRLARPAQARFVRLVVVRYHSKASLRMGVTVCPAYPAGLWGFFNGDFEMEDTATNVSRAPAAWSSSGGVSVVRSGNKLFGGGAAAQSGKYYVALQRRGAFLEQNLTLAFGVRYVVAFTAAYPAGASRDAKNASLSARVGGELVQWGTRRAPLLVDGRPASNFTRYAFDFVAKPSGAGLTQLFWF